MFHSQDENTLLSLKKQSNTPNFETSNIAANLIYKTGTEIFDYLFAPIGNEKARIDFIATLYRQNKNALSYLHSFWLNQGEEKIGFILGYDGDYEQELTFQTIYLVFKYLYSRPHTFFSMLYKFFIFQKMSLDVPPKMYYIAHFAILPQHFRKGYGARMMRDLESTLREEGYAYMCLDVTCDNEGAVALYKKFGFEITKTITNKDVEQRTVLKKRYRMEKKVN